jgi:ethanolamine utilization cobalamin adenosyltransferase
MRNEKREKRNKNISKVKGNSLSFKNEKFKLALKCKFEAFIALI